MKTCDTSMTSLSEPWPEDNTDSTIERHCFRDSRSLPILSEENAESVLDISVGALLPDTHCERKLAHECSKPLDGLKRSHISEIEITERMTKRSKSAQLSSPQFLSQTPSSVNSEASNAYSRIQQNSTFSYPLSSRSTPTDPTSRDASELGSPVTESTEARIEGPTDQAELQTHQSDTRNSTTFAKQSPHRDSSSCEIELNKSDVSGIALEEANDPLPVPRAVLIIDYTLPVEQYSWTDIKTMKKAAELFLSSSLLEDAFKLYLLLWKRVQCTEEISNAPSPRNSNPLTEWSTIIALSRSATTPSHLLIIQKLLEQKLAAITATSQEPNCEIAAWPMTTANWDFQSFLLNMLLADICQRQGEAQTGKLHMQTASSSLPDISQISRLWSALVPEVEGIHLDFFYYLVRGYLHRTVCALDTTSMVQSLLRDLDKLQQVYLAQQQGLFIFQYGQIQNPVIRKCLKWCVIQLKRIKSLPLGWEPLKHDPNDSGETKHFIVHFFLWIKWNLEVQKGGPLSTLSVEIEQSGLSTAGLLDLICATIMSNLSLMSKGPLWSVSRYKTDGTLELFREAAAMASKLAQTPDTELVDRLSFRFVSRNGDRYSAWQSLQPRTELRGVVARLVEETLNLQLPATPDSESPQPSDGFIFSSKSRQRSSNRSSSTRSRAYDPTLAPSYSSSERSSMQRLSMRIKGTHYAKRISPSMAPSMATRLSYFNMFNKRPPSEDAVSALSSSIGSINLSTEPSPQSGSPRPVSTALSTFSRADALSVVEEIMFFVRGP